MKQKLFYIVILAALLITACAGGSPTAAPAKTEASAPSEPSAPEEGGEAVLHIGWIGKRIRSARRRILTNPTVFDLVCSPW
jgi:hypothetical protein